MASFQQHELPGRLAVRVRDTLPAFISGWLESLESYGFCVQRCIDAERCCYDVAIPAVSTACFIGLADTLLSTLSLSRLTSICEQFQRVFVFVILAPAIACDNIMAIQQYLLLNAPKIQLRIARDMRQVISQISALAEPTASSDYWSEDNRLSRGANASLVCAVRATSTIDQETGKSSGGFLQLHSERKLSRPVCTMLMVAGRSATNWLRSRPPFATTRHIWIQRAWRHVGSTSLPRFAPAGGADRPVLPVTTGFSIANVARVTLLRHLLVPATSIRPMSSHRQVEFDIATNRLADQLKRAIRHNEVEAVVEACVGLARLVELSLYGRNMLQQGMGYIARSAHENSLNWALKICKTLEGNGTPLGVGEFQIVLAIFAQRQQPRQAARIVETMRGRGMPVTVSAYNLWISAHLESLDLFGALGAYESMRTSGVAPNEDTYRQLTTITYDQLTPCNIILDRMARHRDSPGADYMLQYMVDVNLKPDSTSYGLAMRAHQRHGNVASVTRLYEYMREQNIPITHDIGVRMVAFFARLHNAAYAQQVMEHMRQAGLSPDVYCYTALIHTHAKKRDLKAALQTFDSMTENGVPPNRWTLNSLVRAYADCGYPEEAKQVISDITEAGIVPNQYTYRPLIEHYARSGQLEEVQAMLKYMGLSGLSPDNVVISAVIMAYVDADRMDDAHTIVSNALERNMKPYAPTFNRLLIGYSRSPNIEGALRVLKEMAQYEVLPTKATYDILIRLFSRLADPSAAVRVLHEQRAAEIEANNYTYVPLLAAYAAAGDVDGAGRIFQIMAGNGTPSVEAYNVLMHTYAFKGDIEQTMRVYADMRAHQVEPDEVTYSTLICRLVEVGAIHEAERIYAIARPRLREARVYNAIINAYISQGDQMQARRIYNELLSGGTPPDALTYTLLMRAYAVANDPQSARATMEEMTSRGFTPDIVHYTTLLKAHALGRDAISAELIYIDMQERGVKLDPIAWLWLLRAFINHHVMMMDAWEEMLRQKQGSPQAVSVLINGSASRQPMLRKTLETWEKIRSLGIMDVRNYNQLAAALAKHKLMTESCDVLEALHEDKPLDYVEGARDNIWTWVARSLLSGLVGYRNAFGDAEAASILARLEKAAPQIYTLNADEERIRREGAPRKPRRQDDPRGPIRRIKYRDVKLSAPS